MDPENIQQVVDEIGPLVIGRYFGKLFQLDASAWAIDFGLREGRYLFISVDPASARLHLIKRRLKDLAKGSISRSQFAQLLVSRVSGAHVTSITRDADERVIRMTLEGTDESGNTQLWTLLAQLTGRSANLFLLDKDTIIVSAARSASVNGQSIGDLYRLPTTQPSVPAQKKSLVIKGDHESLSAALDAHYQELENKNAFERLATKARSKVRQELQQRVKLKSNLEQDLASHGNPDEHKRIGDLLLANISTAKRNNSKTLLKDFYSEGEPEIELEIDKETPLQDEAARYFSRYSKAKRAKQEIEDRLNHITDDLHRLSQKQEWVERLIEARDIEILANFVEPSQARPRGSRAAEPTKIPGVRVYRSSDGYEVLVGRGARDNDQLTFRIAKPNDLWLHSADYPGSHVVIRREQRKEIPHRTIVEAAQLAARFSQASNDAKVVIHYTPRKFLSKPKGSAPGLVRMSSFKTIVVEPKEVLKRV